MDSILTSIKRLLGIEADYTQFDDEIIMAINSSLGILTQLGVGPADGFYIADASAKWSDFVTDIHKMEYVKSYVHFKTKLLFDPPSSTSLIAATNDMLKELEFRLYVTADNAVLEDGDE